VRRLLLIAVGLALLATAPGASAATRAGGSWQPVAPEGGALDLSAVSLGQDERELVFRAKSKQPITHSLLSESGGGEICLAVDPRSGATRRLCLSRESNRWQVKMSGRAIDAKVSQPRATELDVRFRPGEAGLRNGAVAWSVFARAAGCVSVMGLGGKVEGPAVRLAAEPELPCAHQLPRTGSYDGRVYDVKVSGCVATGPAQVTRGPKVKRVALTYDDGPAVLTPSFMAKLKSLGVPATFFMIGQQVGGRAALVRQMLADGHMVANHSWSHPNMSSGGPAASSQLSRTNAAIRKATGFTPCLFRPPYGGTGADLVRRTRAQGMTSILWSVDPLDWRSPGAGSIVSRVVSGTGPGAIILSHDGGGPRGQTLSALPGIVKALKRKGYEFVTVNELLGYREKLSLVR
jgi:peptidoglycan/xylan/chitin deacetylase (PgdA/CDA1 family)